MNERDLCRLEGQPELVYTNHREKLQTIAIVLFVFMCSPEFHSYFALVFPLKVCYFHPHGVLEDYFLII